MIPTTIARLAKRHKRLKKELVEKFALSYDQMETMDAVDLVLDCIVKLKGREKKQHSAERQKNPDLEKALKYLRDTHSCPSCHSINIDGGWVTAGGQKYLRNKCKDCGTEWEERFVLGKIQRSNIFSPC